MTDFQKGEILIVVCDTNLGPPENELVKKGERVAFLVHRTHTSLHVRTALNHDGWLWRKEVRRLSPLEQLAEQAE